MDHSVFVFFPSVLISIGILIFLSCSESKKSYTEYYWSLGYAFNL